MNMNKTIINKIKDKIPKSWAIRKGCFWCRGPLITVKEKILRTCDSCARSTLDASTSFSKGNIKEGKEKMVDVMFGKTTLDKEDIHDKANKTINKRHRTIVKMARKKGISEDEALKAIQQLKA